jgi:hypothetical protein
MLAPQIGNENAFKAVCPQLARPTETIATAAAATALMRVVILMTFLQTSFIVCA